MSHASDHEKPQLAMAYTAATSEGESEADRMEAMPDGDERQDCSDNRAGTLPGRAGASQRSGERDQRQARLLAELAQRKSEFDNECRLDGAPCLLARPRSGWCDLCTRRDQLMTALHELAQQIGRGEEGVWQWFNAPTTYLPHHKKPIDYAYSNPDLVLRAARAHWGVDW